MHEVSVVMSVYDNAANVSRTVESVLEQAEISLEYIIIDDGATPSVKKALSNYSPDPRVRIITQTNQGLTRALIAGCQLASHEFIARIDAGDTMTTNRLCKQASLLNQKMEVGLVCSWVNTVTEEDYFLYDFKADATELKEALRSDVADQVRTPVHASVMFRKSLYDQVQGYREEFYFAQDCDLWSRMMEYADIFVLPETLTMAVFSQNGISGRYADEQKRLKSLIAEANGLRQLGKDDVSVLSRANKIRPDDAHLNSTTNKQGFASLYFIASCLSKNCSIYAKQYWWRAIKQRPWSIVSWLRFFLAIFYRS